MNCIHQNEKIDQILNSYKVELGKYFEQYHNHVYRVYNFAIPFVELNRDIEILSIAAAFHDLGIWTNNTFDYINPSIVLAKKYCLENGLNNEINNKIETIIKEHHKLTEYKSLKLAEIFRHADMTDLSLGLIRNGISRNDIRMIKKTFPNKGFHFNLSRLFFKNLFINPLRPLPMYKL